MKSPFKKKEESLKKENIRSSNNAWKDYLKTWDLEPPAGFLHAAIKLNPL